MMNFTALVEQYRRLRESLIVEFPELVEDNETLADTLEGETELPDVISRFIRDARHDEAMAIALGGIIKEEQERKARLGARADKRRAIALALMSSAQMRNLVQPDFSASIRFVPPKVEITDDTKLPDQFVRITRTPDKIAIREALGKGEQVPGAGLGNGSETLSIRTR